MKGTNMEEPSSPPPRARIQTTLERVQVGPLYGGDICRCPSLVELPGDFSALWDPGYLPLEDSPCSALKEPANKKHTPEPGRRFPSSSSVLPVPCAGHCLQDNEG